MKFVHILTLLAVASTTACTLEPFSPLGHKRLFLYGVPRGSDPFSQGWRDGCDTSFASLGTGTLRFSSQEQINNSTTYKMTHDPLYDKGFNVGSGYCGNFLDYNSG
jgi:hypothetical protein